MTTLNSLEIFTGAGGLAMGTSIAGFKHRAVVEWNRNACKTIRYNQSIKSKWVYNWPLHEMDISKFKFNNYENKVDLIAGGPPCQPFSLAGKHRGEQDERNMFPQVFRAVREIKPRVILLENVKGLLRKTFSEYFEYIILQLTYPEITRKANEKWWEHLSRLERQYTRGDYQGLSYRVLFRLLNAADYGVPQRRERVFIVGIRSDLGIEWSFPGPTHSQDALLKSQWVDGSYWEKHKVSSRNRPQFPIRKKERIMHLKNNRVESLNSKPWLTVRDAISDLPDPRKKVSSGIQNHEFQAGARIYKGHTGSPLDEPAKTLKAGDHGVPGGENMFVYPNGDIRYFTVRESARLQTFPDDFIFHGSWTESMRQLGNAVPVTLANIVATDIYKLLVITNEK